MFCWKSCFACHTRRIAKILNTCLIATFIRVGTRPLKVLASGQKCAVVTSRIGTAHESRERIVPTRSESLRSRGPIGLVSRAAGGEGGIRTHGTVARTPHFECGAFDHSATSPLEQAFADGSRLLVEKRAPSSASGGCLGPIRT